MESFDEQTCEVQKAIFPAVLLGIVFLIWISIRLALPENGISEGENGRNFISVSYPQEIQQWGELISVYAGQYNLDADLIAALIWQESGGNPQAYSASGAVGLMQIMPSDGLAAGFICTGGPCFVNRPTSEQLYQPEFNIYFGCDMLSGMLYRYGDLREALKAYGPADIGYEYADTVLNIYQNYRAVDNK